MGRQSWVFLFVLICGSWQTAHGFTAIGGSRGSDEEQDHFLSLAGGIASPSAMTTLTENPAGLIYNLRTKIHLTAATPDAALNSFGYSGSFFTGNGYVGAGVGAQSYDYQRSTYAGSIALFSFGVGAFFDSLNVSFGLVGITPGSGTAWGINMGVIYNPKGKARAGATVSQLLDASTVVGLGVAAELNPWADIGIDFVYNVTRPASVIKPELGIHLSGYQMNIGYGFQTVGTPFGGLRQGLSLAFGLNLGSLMLIQLYYNHLAQYMLASTMRF